MDSLKTLEEILDDLLEEFPQKSDKLSKNPREIHGKFLGSSLSNLREKSGKVPKNS